MSAQSGKRDGERVTVEMAERGEANGDQEAGRLSNSRSFGVAQEVEHPGVIVPRPFKSMTQVLTLTYLSVLCCLCVGAYANKQAWKANTLMTKGNPAAAQRHARTAARVAFAGILLGITIFSALIAIIVVTWKY